MLPDARVLRRRHHAVIHLHAGGGRWRLIGLSLQHDLLLIGCLRNALRTLLHRHLNKHTRHLIKITQKPQNITRRAKRSTRIPDTEALWDTAPSRSESDWPFRPERRPAIGSESAELPSCLGNWGVERA